MEFDSVPAIAKYLSVIYLLTRFGSNTVWFFLPLFFEMHIDSVFLIGIMTSIPAAIPVLMDIPMGNLVQRAGEKIVIFIGLMMNLMPGLFYLTGVPLLLVMGKVFEGFVKTMIWNGGWTLSLKSANSSNEAESNSVFLLGVNLASVIGPIIGGFLIASHGFNLTFALWVFSAWLGALVFYLYIGLEGRKGFIDSLEDLFHRKTYADEKHHLRQNWHNLKRPLSLIFLYSIIFSFFWLAVPFLLEDLNASYEMMGIIFGIAALPKLFQIFFGDLGDKFGDLKVVSLLALLLIPVLILMSFTSNIYLVGLFFLISRLFVSGISPVIHAFYDSQVPDEVEGEMTGFLEFSKHTGQAIGPAMAGAVASIGSINLSFQVAAFVAFLLFAASYWFQ
ncbi:MAG: MFS family permease [Candidatus Nanohaloarchaea archaeon]|jgi:MFS family permease